MRSVQGSIRHVDNCTQPKKCAHGIIIRMSRPKGSKNKVKVEERPVKKSLYFLSLVLGDKTFTSEGETLFDALKEIPKPEKIMNKAVLTITKGDQKKELLYYPTRLKRLFYNKHFKEIQAKQIEVLFQ